MSDRKGRERELPVGYQFGDAGAFRPTLTSRLADGFPVNGIAGLFNPSREVSEVYERVRRSKWWED